MPTSDKYGLMTTRDAEILEYCLDVVITHKEFKCWKERAVLEIGVHTGGTALGIKKYLEAHNLGINYWGIENSQEGQIHKLWNGAHVIYGDSLYVADKAPFGFQLTLIDGCHCLTHVVMDFLQYAPLSHPGGIILIHDCHPECQGAYQNHDGFSRKEIGVNVRKAVDLLGLRVDHPMVELLIEGWSLDPKDKWGGLIGFIKK